jgi:hippurate hydrolase
MLCRTLAAVVATCLVIPAARAAGPAPANRSPAHAAAVRDKVAADCPSLEDLYKHLHAHPDLSYHEQKSAARMAKELRELGFTVTEHVGGHGVVGVLKNGDGPTVLVRTDLDALPVVEATGLPYASKVTARDKDGNEVGVMHACGHDMHMTCWVGTARVLAALKDHWRGTLVFIGQPAEEVGAGARSMLDGGLFTNFPRPDYALALHCDSFQPHGTVAFTEGLALANVDSVDILVKGKGGHGSAPHTTIDPIVLAARIILDLQTLVSRETNPTDPAVVSVGSIHGGAKHNVIPNEVKLKITVRSTKDAVRKQLLDGIKRVAEAAAAGARAPAPEVTFRPEEFTPALLNDPKLTRRTIGLFKDVLGDGKVVERPPVMGGEDFSRYGRAGVPIFLYFLGTQAPEKVAAAAKEGRSLPSLHSDSFAPVPEPTIKTGVLTMSLAVLDLLNKGK